MLFEIFEKLGIEPLRDPCQSVKRSVLDPDLHFGSITALNRGHYDHNRVTGPKKNGMAIASVCDCRKICCSKRFLVMGILFM
jgi:hypothetical protein